MSVTFKFRQLMKLIRKTLENYWCHEHLVTKVTERSCHEIDLQLTSTCVREFKFVNFVWNRNLLDHASKIHAENSDLYGWRNNGKALTSLKRLRARLCIIFTQDDEQDRGFDFWFGVSVLSHASLFYCSRRKSWIAFLVRAARSSGLWG